MYTHFDTNYSYLVVHYDFLTNYSLSYSFSTKNESNLKFFQVKPFPCWFQNVFFVGNEHNGHMSALAICAHHNWVRREEKGGRYGYTIPRMRPRKRPQFSLGLRPSAAAKSL